jgi:hypothetical protein
MKALASSFGAWKLLERQEGIKVPHGLVFSLATVQEIGRPHGLQMVAEEEVRQPIEAGEWDAIMVSVLDTRCLINAASFFRQWGIPVRRRERGPVGRWPLVWAGGQGIHNPLPLAPIADLMVIGDAEDPLPELLELWGRHGNSPGFLAAAATVPGVYVPSEHDPSEVTIKQSVATDLSVTLDSDISVSHDGTRRLEIARGCRYKCTFCTLGWRAPARENPVEAIVREIERSPKRVHLQAGDAESHSGIDQIRQALSDHGGSDQGWTGRLDTLFENPDQTIPGQKRYAFGVEGVSHRLRRAVGKGYLSDERLADDTVRFFGQIEGDGKGRAAWHMIAGLPTERVTEARELAKVIREIDRRMRGQTPRNLALHWQPLQPIPGTPMQWCASGGGARRMKSVLSMVEGLPRVHVHQNPGRTDGMAKLCTLLSRADERGADLIEAVADETRVRPDQGARITGATWGAIDPDAPLPWDFVERPHGKAVLRRAYDVMWRRLRGEEPLSSHAEPTRRCSA